MSFSHGGYGDPMISRVGDEQVQLGIREKECHILVPVYTYTQGKGAPHPFSFASGYISGLVRTIKDDCLGLLTGCLNTLVKVYHGAHLISWKIASGHTKGEDDLHFICSSQWAVEELDVLGVILRLEDNVLVVHDSDL
jgi:hypothetical protein